MRRRRRSPAPPIPATVSARGRRQSGGLVGAHVAPLAAQRVVVAPGSGRAAAVRSDAAAAAAGRPGGSEVAVASAAPARRPEPTRSNAYRELNELLGRNFSAASHNPRVLRLAIVLGLRQHSARRRAAAGEADSAAADATAPRRTSRDAATPPAMELTPLLQRVGLEHMDPGITREESLLGFSDGSMTEVAANLTHATPAKTAAAGAGAAPLSTPAEDEERQDREEGAASEERRRSREVAPPSTWTPDPEVFHDALDGFQDAFGCGGACADEELLRDEATSTSCDSASAHFSSLLERKAAAGGVSAARAPGEGWRGGRDDAAWAEGWRGVVEVPIAPQEKSALL